MNKVYSATLTVTNRCNLNCIYCYEKHKSHDTMSFEKARDIVDILVSDYLPLYEGLNIQFFGGEPFLNFPLIQSVVEYVTKTYLHNNIHFLITTNGTLLTEDIKQWLRKYKNILTCGLSLDGKKKSHDINRNNSFELIDIGFFREVWPNYPIKMTVSPQTLPYFAEDIIWLHEQGLNIKCNFAVGIDWSGKKYTSIFHDQLMILSEYYVNNPQVTLCSLLDFNMNAIGPVTENDMVNRYCGIGSTMCAFDVYGEKYPCQFFCENTLGLPYEMVKDIIVPDEYPVSNYTQQCANCVLIRVCPNCYGANYQSSGNCYQKDMNLCSLTKEAAYASSYIKAKRFLSNTSDGDDPSNFFRGILAIQNNIVLDN